MPVRATVDELSGSDSDMALPVQRGSKSRAMKALKAMKVMKVAAKKKAGLVVFLQGKTHLIIYFWTWGCEEGLPEEEGPACQYGMSRARAGSQSLAAQIFCTKTTARVITHKIKLAKVGKISNRVPRFIATMPQLCFLALGRVFIRLLLWSCFADFRRLDL